MGLIYALQEKMLFGIWGNFGFSLCSSIMNSLGINEIWEQDVNG